MEEEEPIDAELASLTETAAALDADAGEEDIALLVEDRADRLFEPREVCVDRRRTFADDLFESLKAEVGNEVGITVQHREIRRRLGKLRLGVREPFTAPVVQQITQQVLRTVLAVTLQTLHEIIRVE